VVPEPADEVVVIDVPVDLASVDGVRHQVLAAAEGWGFAGLTELEVVTSEIVTNAIVHAATPSHLTFRRLPTGAVELAVTDHGGGAPWMRTPTTDDVGGRGLRIVDAVSTSWGVQHGPPDETTVWARLGPFAP
jgi:anti-sigma regulatory factor (Ser/Thr protein kinase)